MRPVEIIENGKFVLHADDFPGDFKTNAARLCLEALHKLIEFRGRSRSQGLDETERKTSA